MKNRSEKRNKCSRKCVTVQRILAIVLILSIMFADILFLNSETVNAADTKNGKKFGLVQTKVSLYVGNTFQLKTTNVETTKQSEWFEQVEYRSLDENVVRVDSEGLLCAVGAGKTEVVVSYMEQSAVCKVDVKANSCKLNETKLTLYKGQKATIILKNSKQKAVSYGYKVYYKETEQQVEYYDFYVENEGNGVFIINPEDYEMALEGTYYFDFFLINEKSERYSARCEVELLACGFSSYGMAVAEGKTLPLDIVNGEFLSCKILGTEDFDSEEEGENRWGEEWDQEWYDVYSSTEQYYEKGYQEEDWEDWEDQEEVLYEGEIRIDEKGNITGVRLGRTRIVVDWRTAYGKVRRDWISVDVTTPGYIPFETKFLIEKREFALEKYIPKFTGLSPYSKITITSSDEDVIALEDKSMEYDPEFSEMREPGIYPRKSGTATVKFVVDGMTFQQKIQVIAVEVRYCFLVKKGQEREQALLSDLPKDCKVTWKIADKKIASVSKEGKVKGKSVGSTEITATVEGKTFSGVVIVGSGKGTDAVLKGEKVLGAQYSQEKRMQKGYYDCSSFVWRSYNAAGLKLCGVNSAPTAAELARKLESEGKVIAYKGIDVKKLKPGDLIFTAHGNNGRYKNIDHVEMYYGTCYTTEDEGVGATIGAGPGSGVQMGYYTYWGGEGASDIVMIARPVQ